MVPRTGRLVLPAPSRERLSCSQMVMSGGGVTSPTTLGLRVPGFPLAAVPVPKRPTKGWLRERCRVLPQRPGSHSVPSSPYDISGASVRNLCTRELEDQTTDASRWTLQGSPSSPPWQCKSPQTRIQQTLCSTVTSPQQLDQGLIIRKLSRDGNEEQILHLILANYCTELQSTS